MKNSITNIASAQDLEYAIDLKADMEPAWPKMFWDDSEAIIVGEALRGNYFELEHDISESVMDWLGVPNDLEKTEASNIVNYAANLITSEYSHRVFLNMLDDSILEGYYSSEPNPSEESHNFEVIHISRVAQQILLDSLRKNGLVSIYDYRRLVSYAGFRSSPDKTGYSCDFINNKDGVKNYPPSGEGGPDGVLALYSPRYSEDTGYLTDARIRRGVAHELAHQLRAFNNTSLWLRHEGLYGNILEKSTSPIIGGLKVASSKQGSEGVGQLIAVFMALSGELKREVTIKEIIPYIAKNLDSKVHEYWEEQKINMRYFASRTSLLKNLLLLKELGYGDESALELIALCTCGYVSIEKVPALVSLGIIDETMHTKISTVLRDITKWFITDETSFKL